MHKKLLTAGLAVTLGTALAIVQGLTQQPPRAQLTIEKVKDDLYNIAGNGGNVAALITSEGVILVDDKFDEDHAAIMEKLKSVTNQPVKYVFTTHYHSDHSGGNVKFLPIAEIISTRNTRTNILEHRQPGAPAGMLPARLVFSEETSLFLGGKEVRARYFGRGHTNGDAVVYFPAEKTVHTGDLMAGASPLIDYNGGGSVVEWTKALDGAINQFEFDTVIPGHGAVTNKAGLITYRNNVEKLRTRVAGLIREHKSQEEVGKVLTAEFGWQPNSVNMQWSLPGMMTELR